MGDYFVVVVIVDLDFYSMVYRVNCVVLQLIH